MIKKLLLLFTVCMVYVMPAKAQNVHVELDYHSFRPFIHFQLDFGNRPYRTYRSGYRSAYLKGYMDGVNDQRYYRHRFTDLVQDFQLYETGYGDGFRDRALLIRLRGRDWYHRHRFVYDDYYAPAYSVRIWLSGLSLAFLQAPEQRLPRRWKRRAHPRFRKYRRWYKKRRHYEDDDNYRRYANFEKRYRNRVKHYERKARKVKKHYRQKASYKGKKGSGGRFKSRRSARKYIKKRIQKSGRNRSNNIRNVRKKGRKAIQKAQKNRRNAIRKSRKRHRKRIRNKQKKRRKKVRKPKRRQRKRDKVRSSRGGKKQNSRRGRGRSNRRDRDH